MENLKQDDRMKVEKARADFFSNMSHDIRTPLNAIIGMAMLAKESLQDTNKAGDLLDKIKIESRLLLSRLNDVFDMSCIYDGRMQIMHELFDLSKAIDEISEIMGFYAAERKITFVVEKDSSMHRFYFGDKNRINQIIMNLVSNSIKFTPKGGRVELLLKEESYQPSNAVFKITVKDTGMGMSESFVARMFEPFEQENADYARDSLGSGLGLTIVRELVTMMDGTVSVKSRLGEGTEITAVIKIELAEEEDTKGFDEGSIEHCDFGRQRVLLVDDNELNLEIARYLLETMNLKVDTAVDGVEALEHFSATEPWYYKMIFMDIRMPGFDGLEVTRRIRRMQREDCAGIPIIAMTANAFQEDREEAMRCGMNGYVTKPVDVKKLVGEIKKYL